MEDLDRMQGNIQALRHRLDEPSSHNVHVPNLGSYSVPTMGAPIANNDHDIESLRSDLVRFAVCAKDRLS